MSDNKALLVDNVTTLLKILAGLNLPRLSHPNWTEKVGDLLGNSLSCEKLEELASYLRYIHLNKTEDLR